MQNGVSAATDKVFVLIQVDDWLGA